MYGTLILPVVLYGGQTLFLTSREEHSPRVLEKRVAEVNIWTETRRIIRAWGTLRDETPHDLRLLTKYN
jgi:hypothetical protein